MSEYSLTKIKHLKRIIQIICFLSGKMIKELINMHIAKVGYGSRKTEEGRGKTERRKANELKIRQEHGGIHHHLEYLFQTQCLSSGIFNG